MGNVAFMVGLGSNSSQRFTLSGNLSILQGIGFVFILFFYFPTKHSRMHGLNNREMIKRIDWAGGALFTTGLTLL